MRAPLATRGQPFVYMVSFWVVAFDVLFYYGGTKARDTRRRRHNTFFMSFRAMHGVSFLPPFEMVAAASFSNIREAMAPPRAISQEQEEQQQQQYQQNISSNKQVPVHSKVPLSRSGPQ